MYISAAVHQISDENFYTRRHVAENFRLSERDLLTLANDPEWTVRATVAENQNISEALFNMLANDKNAHVRASLASNPRLPIDFLRRCAEDRSAEVRRAVADNLSTPVELLEQLSTDKESFVRCGVATNPNTPVDLLCKLAKSRAVGHVVATNPNLPADLRAEMVQKNQQFITQYEFRLVNGSISDDACRELITQPSRQLDGLTYEIRGCMPLPDGVYIETSWIPLYDNKMRVLEDLDGILFESGYEAISCICDHQYYTTFDG